MIFFCGGTDRRKTDAMAVFSGREDHAVTLLDKTVKPVCEENVELSGIFHIDGKADITVCGRDGERALDGIFHQISEDHAEIHVGYGKRGWKVGFAEKRDPLLGGNVAVICQDGIGSQMRAIAETGGIRIRKLPVVIIQIFQEPAVFLLFGKSGDGPDGMAEIVAESAGLCDIGLKARILACLHFQHLVFFFHLSPFCNGMGSFQEECLVEEKQDQERSFNKKRDIKNTAYMHGRIFPGYHINIAGSDDGRKKPDGPPDRALMEVVDNPGKAPGKKKEKEPHSKED